MDTARVSAQNHDPAKIALAAGARHAIVLHTVRTAIHMACLSVGCRSTRKCWTTRLPPCAALVRLPLPARDARASPSCVLRVFLGVALHFGSCCRYSP